VAGFAFLVGFWGGILGFLGFGVFLWGKFLGWDLRFFEVLGGGYKKNKC
jgi:hypothetical protein